MTTVLIVDDELDTLIMFRTWFKRHGFEALTATDGYETLEMARSYQPDLILLDVMLPGMNGIETCKQLRADAQTANIPVVLLTAYDPAVGRVEALMAGAADYITKPVNTQTLLERLGVLLDRQTVARDSRLLDEMVHSALAVVPCKLAWLLTHDPHGRALVSEAVAASQGEDAVSRFLQQVAGDEEAQHAIPFEQVGGRLAEAALAGLATFNLPVARLRDEDERLYEACTSLNLYFVTFLPLQVSGSPLGVLILGSREPKDVESTQGQQILTAVASQAATSIYNTRLFRQLSDREAEKERERAFRQALLDAMSDGLVVYDATGTITFANQRVTLLTGFTGEQLVGERVEALFSPADQDKLRPWVTSPSLLDTRAFELELLRRDGRTVPVLAVQASRQVAAGQSELQRVMVITDLTKQKERERTLNRHTSRLSALNHATRLVSSALSVDDMLRTILEEASGVFEALMTAVLLQMPGEDDFVYRAVIGPRGDRVRGTRVGADDGLVGRVVRTQRPALASNLHDGTQEPHPLVERTGLAIASAALAPLVVDGQVVGMIEILHHAPNVFDQFDLDTLEGLANAAASAIGNARLYGEAQRHVRELTLLLKASETTSSTLAIEHVIELVARHLIDTIQAQWCRVSALDETTGELVHLAELAEIAWPTGQGPRVSLASEGELWQVAVGGREVTLANGHAPSGAAASLLLPLEVAGRVVGVAELGHMADDRGFTSEEIERCRAAQAAWARSLATGPWDSATSLRLLGARLLRAANVARCSLYLLARDGEGLILTHQAGKVVWPMEQGPGAALERGDPRSVALVEQTPVAVRVSEHEGLTGQAVFSGIQDGSLLVAPLVARGETVGLVELVDIKPNRRYSTSDLSLARAIGNVVGNALENARLYSALARRAVQLEAAYNDLQDSDRLKEEWLQNVSHELRTPLSSIIGYVDLMLEGDFGPVDADMRQGLESVVGKSRQLSRLVDDILAIQETEREPLDLTPVTVNDIARAALAACRPVADKAGVGLVASLDPNETITYLDGRRIRQLFDSLLSNAIKFSPGGGRVSLEVRDLGKGLQVTVADEGIGIEPAEQEKIWRRFYQVDGSMTRQYGGTGLGLSIARQIVEKHGGEIWVESEPGQGSAFTFIIPYLTEAEHLP